MVEAAGVELDWGLRRWPITGEFWPDFATRHRPSEQAAPETRDVAGNRGPLRGAHGEAAGTRKRRERTPPPPRRGASDAGTVSGARVINGGYILAADLLPRSTKLA